MTLDTQAIQSLSAALSAENLSFSTYAIMRAVAAESEPLSVARIALLYGYSYHAIWNQIERTPYFTKGKASNGLVSLTLNPEAITKLERIAARLNRAA